MGGKPAHTYIQIVAMRRRCLISHRLDRTLVVSERIVSGQPMKVKKAQAFTGKANAKFMSAKV
jgi:hypothetical protein